MIVYARKLGSRLKPQAPTEDPNFLSPKRPTRNDGLGGMQASDAPLPGGRKRKRELEGTTVHRNSVPKGGLQKTKVSKREPIAAQVRGSALLKPSGQVAERRRPEATEAKRKAA